MYVEDGVGRYPFVPTNLKSLPSVTDFSLVQSLNILPIFITFEVSNPDTSRLVSFEHPENMPYIIVTFEVSKPDRFKLVSAWQSEKIRSILVTFEVSNPDRSRAVNALQP